MLPVTVNVYIDWDNNGNFTGTYDNVSADTLNVGIRRGRSSVNDEFSPGTCTFSLSNESGRYSAYNASSPLYGLILPGLPVKVTATHNSTTYDIFCGYITDYSEQRAQGSAPVVSVNATDGSDILRFGQVRTPLYTAKRVDEILTGILDDASWSASLRDLDTAAESPAYFWAYKQPPLDAMRAAVKQELGGQLFLSAGGKVTFRNRYARSNAALAATVTSAQSLGYEVRREQVTDKVQHSLGNITPDTTASVLFMLNPAGRQLRPGKTYIYNTIEAEIPPSTGLITPTPVGSETADVVSTTSTASMLSGTSHNVSMPATVNAGDLLLAFIATSCATDGNEVTKPAGWVEMETKEEDGEKGTYLRLSSFYKIAVGDEGSSTVDFRTDVAATGNAQVIRLAAGDYNGLPFGSQPVATTDTTQPTPPTLEPSSGYDSYRSVAVCAVVPGGSQSITAYPSGHGENQTTTSSVLTSCSRSVLADSDTPEAFTINSMASPVNLTAITQTVLIRSAMTDYAVNSEQNGTGTDKTAQVSVDTFTSYGNGVMTVFDNLDSVPVYLNRFQIRGYALRSSNDERTFTATVTTPIVTGQVLSDAFEFQNNADGVSGYANYRASVLGAFQPRPQVRLSPRNDSEMALVLGTEIGSRVRLQNTTGQYPTNVSLDAFVEGISLSFSPGVMVDAQWSMFSDDQANGKMFRISGAAGGGQDYSQIAAETGNGYDRIAY